MIAEYKRNYDHSYMILEDEDNETNYEEKMLLHNDLKSLLVLEIMSSDEKKQYWYDITGRESLRTYLDYEKFSFDEIETLFQYLIYAMEETEEYLLDPGHILLSVDGIFFDRNTKTPSFAYFPFEEKTFQESLRSFIEELLRSMNHEDALFVSTMYEIYEMILKETYSIEEILKAIRSKKPSEPCKITPPQVQNKESFTENFVDDYEYDDFDLEVPKPKSFLTRKRKKKEKNQIFRHSKKEEVVMYMQPDEKIQSSETVLLTGSFVNNGEKLVYSGNHNHSDYSIDDNTILIGSAEEQNNLVIKSASVSKRHARLTRSGNNIFLEDLNSTNGTYVNGDPLSYQEKRLLKKNDKIHFADEMYVLE